MKRKAHYNEYYAVKLARKLLEEEDEENEEEDEDEDDDMSDERDRNCARPSCSRNQPSKGSSM